MTDYPMMTCGHAANATRTMPDGTIRPSCAICFVDTVADETPDLEGRQARCGYDHGSGCPKLVGRDSRRPSALSLAFFEHTPDKEYDAYYCGCWGWN